MYKINIKILSTLALLASITTGLHANSISDWTEEEVNSLKHMWIKSLPPLEDDMSNRYANNPKAAALGKKLFFDSRFSSNGKVSCSSCHNPQLNFTDGKVRSQGIASTRRNSPGLLGTSYSKWFFWDGRADSQWAQALGPLEDSREHGGNRSQYAHLIRQDKNYKSEYEAIFGLLPDISNLSRFPLSAGPVHEETANSNWLEMSRLDQEIITQIFVNLGKTLAAYERTLMPSASRLDQYIEAVMNGNSDNKILNNEEVSGLKIFIGKGACVICHNGPLFTTHEFKNIGLPRVEELGLDKGRFNGVKDALVSEFNCMGKYSDAKKSECLELRFVKTLRDETIGAFKIPSLRNVENTAPYMHAGQFKSLGDVLKHYQKRPITRNGHSDLLPNNLTDQDLKYLEAFLHTL